MKRVYDQIGQEWFRDVKAHRDTIPVGRVWIALTLSADGKITKLRVVSNTSNELLAKISLKAIKEAKIPRLPAELLTNGKFEDKISFEMRP